MAESPLPVTLLAGFLGAGKTTLLNRLLSSPGGPRLAVIVNEFGAVGVDGRLVVRRDEELVELANGCLCCELRVDLREALLGLAGRRGRGAAFDHVVVEGSGLAVPGPAAQTLRLDPALRDRFALAGVVTVAHAGHVVRQLAEHPEVAGQLAVADRALLNHVDTVTDAARCAAREAVQRAAPLAEVRETVRAEVGAPWVLAPADPRAGLDGRPARALAVAGLASPVAVAHGRDVRAVVLGADAPLDRETLEHWLRFLAQRRTLALLRVKGVLATRRAGGPVEAVVVQGVHQWLELSPAPGPPPARSELVVIARGLDEAELRRGFAAAVQAPRTLPDTP